ncbi:MAG: PQQ-dependent sugar dehydrogenase [Chloroflexota bacterium]
MTGILRLALAAVMAMLLAAGHGPGTSAEASLPPGFSDAVVASVPQPIDLAVVERGGLRGALYVTSKSGRLYFVPLSGQPRVALDLGGSTCSDGERGLLGVALDPRFGAGENSIYLYHTVSDGGSCFNRVSRFSVRPNGAVDAASGQPLAQTARLVATNHNGGDLEFGADGMLYVSVGDNARPSLAQKRTTYFGKILRITTEGRPAAGNPYRVSKGAAACGMAGRAKKAPCAEIFALGLRNPFQIAFAPGSSTFAINDVGQYTWEEVDLGRKGANYGWPQREGPCPQGQTLPCADAPAAMTNPATWYGHDTGCESITGGAFVPASANWPAEYAGDYLFADFVCGSIFAAGWPPSGSPAPFSTFATGLGMIVALEFDPVRPGTLLYTNLNGEVRRITVE